jgi:hypothetical protein
MRLLIKRTYFFFLRPHATYFVDSYKHLAVAHVTVQHDLTLIVARFGGTEDFLTRYSSGHTK